MYLATEVCYVMYYNTLNCDFKLCDTNLWNMFDVLLVSLESLVQENEYYKFDSIDLAQNFFLFIALTHFDINSLLETGNLYRTIIKLK